MVSFRRWEKLMAIRTENTVLWMGPLRVSLSARAVSGAGVIILDMDAKIRVCIFADAYCNQWDGTDRQAACQEAAGSERNRADRCQRYYGGREPGVSAAI